MKNIAIIGDSWSIGVHIGHVDGFSPFEFTLMNKNNTVYARGHGGSNNLYELTQFEYFLDGTKDIFDIDLVIWFHTELLRDHLNFRADPKDLDIGLSNIAKETYETATAIKNKYPAMKWAIIGGHEPILKHREMLDWADFIIDDWRSELVGEKLPYTNFLGHIHFLEKNVGKIDSKRIEEEIVYRNKIIDICNERRDIFFDGIHPNSKAFNKLALRIKQHFGF
jgi:hypothetical protein